MSTPHLARCARLVLLVFCAAPAVAQTEVPVPSVYGEQAEAALKTLEEAGFESFEFRLDGAVATRAEIEAASAVVAWTSPPEWKTAAPGSTLAIGFETKVRIANHVGDPANEAADAARSIGYLLVEGSPSSGSPIADDDERVIASFHADSPAYPSTVAVGAYVGVVLIAPTMPQSGLSTSLIVGGLIGALVGGVATAMILKSKSTKAVG